MNDIARLHVEFLCGSDVTNCIHQAIDLATEYKCRVTFDFNGVELYVHKDSKAQEIKNFYYYMLAK